MPNDFSKVKDFQEGYKDCRKKSELSNVLFAGSYVASGEGVAVVCAVGPHTQYGMHMQSKYSVSMLDLSDDMKLTSLLDEYLSRFTWFSYLISVCFLSYMLLN
jgi:magnesium-transporting ATPase (P-type)